MPLPRPQLDPTTQQRRLRQGVAMLWLGIKQACSAVLWLGWIWVRRILGVFLALIVLFEQWGWKPLVAALGYVARLAPVAAIEGWIGRLPPYAALFAFALPTVFLLPLKLVALYLIAHGHAVSAACLFIGAKVVGTAVVARLYLLTSPQLMQIAWFRRAHDVIVPLLHKVHEDIRRSWAWRYGRMLKTKTKLALAPVVARIKSRLAALFSIGRG